MPSLDFEERRNERRDNPFISTGGYQAPASPAVQAQPQPQQPSNPFDANAVRSQLESVSRGVAVSDQDVQDAIRRAQGYSGYTLDRSVQDFADQYARRASNGPTPQAAPQFRNPQPQFADPSARLLEDYALDRFGQRVNPDPRSGTAQYEAYLKDLSSTLRGPVYSAGDEAVIKGRLVDDLERERQATKQRWIEQISRMGQLPSSGPALEGLRRIDDHYNTLKTQIDADFAREAIGQTRTQRFQVADVLGNLAGSEEGRLSDAANYARIPLALQDRSYAQGQQLVNAGGSPGGFANSALDFLTFGQNQQRYNSQQRQALAQSLLEYYGYLFPGGR